MSPTRGAGWAVWVAAIAAAALMYSSWPEVNESANMSPTRFRMAVGSPPSGTLLWREEFNDSSLIARGWYDQYDFYTIDPDTAFRGAGSLEVAWASSAQGASWVGVRRLFGDTVDHYATQFRVKLDANWAGSGQTYNPHILQFMTNEDGEFTGTAYNRGTHYVEFNYVSGTGTRGVVQTSDHVLVDTVSYGGDEGANWPWPDSFVDSTETRSVNGCNGMDAATTASGSCYLAGTWRNDRTIEADSGLIANGSIAWHLVEAEVKLNTVTGSVGNADGEWRMWIDSTLVIERTGVIFRTGDYPAMGVHNVILAPYIADGSPIAQSLWIDDLAVCSGGRCPAPPS